MGVRTGLILSLQKDARRQSRPPVASWTGRIILALIAVGIAAQVEARPFTLEGLTFSDELGDFEILSASGTGTLDDPFVIVEAVTGPEPVLLIGGLSADFTNRIGSHHLTGFALRKVAFNRTDFIWMSYNLELRQSEDAHSPYGDGLSFGQASDAWRPFASSVFVTSEITDEPADTVVFTDGSVKPGESTTLDMVITDTSPVGQFRLLQSPDRPVALLAPAR
jgi:hypothetical protein